MFGGGGFLCSFSPTGHGDFGFQTVGAAPPPSSRCSSTYLQKKSPASESVGQGDSLNGLSCRSSQLLAFHLPNLPLHEALFYQHHSLKRISATPNLSVEGLLVAHFALPLPLFVFFVCFFHCPLLCLIPRILLSSCTVCHPSVLMRGRDQRGRPLEFDRATCCVSLSVSLSLSLNTRAVDSWQFDSKLFPSVRE